MSMLNYTEIVENAALCTNTYVPKLPISREVSSKSNQAIKTPLVSDRH